MLLGDQGLLGLGILEDLRSGTGSLDCSALALAGLGLFVTGGKLVELLVTGRESGILHAASRVFNWFTCRRHMVPSPSIKTLCMTLPKFSLIMPGTHLFPPRKFRTHTRSPIVNCLGLVFEL